MKKLFLFALVAASLSACKKDSENMPSKMELLTAKSWRVSAYTSTRTVATTGSAPVVTTTDEYASFPACEKDNFVKFSTNKTMVQDEGATRCSSGAAQQENYTWDFNSDQTKLLVTAVGSTNTDTSDLAELSATTLKIRDTNSYTAGTTTVTTVSEVTFTAF